MRIQSGKLDRTLELLVAGFAPGLEGEVVDEFGQRAPDEYGQEVTTFETVVASIAAQRLEMRTQDAARGGGRETFAMARFLIRWRAGLTTSMRIRTDGKLYDILSIEESDRRAALILTLEEVTRG